MPGFNQRGPMGQGPMTGRRMGRCTNFGAAVKKDDNTSVQETEQESPSVFWGRGFGFRGGRGEAGSGGRGRGRGMGFQNRYRGGF
ncbi:MAG: DUF5320 domain-containing protein [Bacteroidetes bacterium]|nr:DUF5320 domain-containing protein [Bacteroidota bacterium]